MTSPEILTDRIGRPWALPKGAPADFTPLTEWSGTDARYPLAVGYATAERHPRVDDVRKLWKARHGNVPNPLLLVVAYPEEDDWRAAICGPAGDDPPVEAGLDLGQVERLADAALNEPTRHAAIRFLSAMWAELETELPGLRNAGMLASHELRDGVPTRADWDALCERGRPLLDHHGRDLVQQLGFTIEAGPTSASVLNVAETKRAVAVFLDEGEEFEQAADRFGSTSPVSYALALADRESLPWVVATRGRQIRVYSARPDVGVGRKGRAETYIEANLALLPDDRAGYVPLLFSADALVENGTFDEVLEGSRDYAADLGSRLRDRVYEDAVPSLAMALAQRHAGDLDDEALGHVYEQALTVLFRLLFVAYAEDKDLLPYRSNGSYREHALKTRARDLAERAAAGTLDFDGHATDLWDEVATLWLAVDKGNTERGVPAYNGGLFSSDPSVSGAGAALGGVRLTNSEFGPTLVAMLVDEADGAPGPVDFRSLSVREFGTIYEGLLESSLSIAPSDLTLDARKNYVPAAAGDEVVVEAGAVYFHNRSGARKSTGSYFTKPFAVEHLLDHALEPALDDHLARVSALVDEGEEAKAAEAFFDFRCVDIAMGSGHFLVAAVDRIEARLSAFLALRPIPQVVAELERLRAAALEALGPLGEGAEVEHASLLRRQVARRCVYGVDLNPIAVELARLAIWIHTFVPGLPLSFLDHTLVAGNSLVGVGTIDEAVSVLDPGSEETGTTSYLTDDLMRALDQASSALRRLAQATDATAAEIAEARAAQHDARAAVQPVQDLFDLVIAAQLESGTTHEDRVRLPVAFDETAIASNPHVGRARSLLGELSRLHFPVTFPEVFLRDRAGFDCVLGNPPWDKVRFEPQQFWVSRSPGLNALAADRRDAAINRLREQRTDDAAIEQRERRQREQLQALAATFSRQGSGHHEFAKLFVERALRLQNPSGSLGYVLPRQWVVLRGWTPLRSWLLDRGTLRVDQLRNAGGWLFDDVEHRYMITLVSSLGRRSPVVRIAAGARNPRELRDTSWPFLELSRTDVSAITDSDALPWLNGAHDRVVFDRLRLRPRLGGISGWIQADVDSGRWDFSGSGRDRSYASSEVGDGAWRVLMTRHVRPFELATEVAFQRFVADPQALVHLGRGVVEVAGQPSLADDHPLVVVRYPSRNDDARTIIAAALPEVGFLFSTGYVHGLEHPSGTSLDAKLALLAYLNSFTADWWARRFVDRHVTKPVVVNLPLPDWSELEIHEAAGLSRALVSRRGVTTLPGGHTITENSEVAGLDDLELICRLEMLVLRGFELSADDLSAILADFSDNGCPAPLRERMLEHAA